MLNSRAAPQQVNHWCRLAMNRATTEFVSRLYPDRLDALEISGSAWRTMGFKSYGNAAYPAFDICNICKQIIAQSFDIIIAEQVFEHIQSPHSAV